MFADTQALTFFPTTVWAHQLGPEETTRINDGLRTALNGLLASAPAPREGQKLQTEQNLHTLPEFDEFSKMVMAAGRGVMEFMHVAEEGLEITSCWANFHPRGGFNPPHTHPNNYLGGVYYVDTPDESGAITFEDPRAQPRIVSPRVSQYTAENTGRATMNVQPGLLLLFPAWLVHSVEPNPSDRMRISISFNLMFSDYTEKVSPAQWEGHVRTG